MEIVRLPRGELAAVDTDCSKINEASRGKFTLLGSALVTCEPDGVAESVAIVASDLYPSFEAAEAAGLAWAAEQCAAIIHVETGGGSEPVRN